jgi:hypothetical protein
MRFEPRVPPPPHFTSFALVKLEGWVEYEIPTKGTPHLILLALL